MKPRPMTGKLIRAACRSVHTTSLKLWGGNFVNYKKQGNYQFTIFRKQPPSFLPVLSFFKEMEATLVIWASVLRSFSGRNRFRSKAMPEHILKAWDSLFIQFCAPILCRLTLSKHILEALLEIIGIQMTPDQDKLACPRTFLVRLGGTVENIENLSYSLNDPLGSLTEKPALQPVDIICWPLVRLVARKDVFPQHRPQPGIQR